MPDLKPQNANLVRDLSHPDTYNRKHAAWTLARLAQKDGMGRGMMETLTEAIY